MDPATTGARYQKAEQRWADWGAKRGWEQPWHELPVSQVDQRLADYLQYLLENRGPKSEGIAVVCAVQHYWPEV